MSDLTWGGGGEEDTQPGLVINTLTTGVSSALRQTRHQVKHSGLKHKIELLTEIGAGFKVAQNNFKIKWRRLPVFGC